MLAFANLGPPAVWYLRAAQMRVPQLICQYVVLMVLPTPTGVFANQPAVCQVASEDSRPMALKLKICLLCTFINDTQHMCALRVLGVRQAAHAWIS